LQSCKGQKRRKAERDGYLTDKLCEGCLPTSLKLLLVLCLVKKHFDIAVTLMHNSWMTEETAGNFKMTAQKA
jgi:hypothetical protein